MAVALARRLNTVVTAEAIASDVDVIEIGGQPAIGRVTIITVVAACNVRRVLAGRCDAIVAGATGAQYLGMVNGYCRQVGYGAVAILADIAGLNMSHTLARGCNAVVAGNAIADDTGVIKKCGQPPRDIVAVVALIVG